MYKRFLCFVKFLLLGVVIIAGLMSIIATGSSSSSSSGSGITGAEGAGK